MNEYKSQSLAELEKEHQEALNVAQNKMLKDLTAAQASGDTEKLQAVSTIFQDTAQQLIIQYTKGIETINALNLKNTTENIVEVYDNSRADIDLNALVYDGDRDYVFNFSER